VHVHYNGVGIGANTASATTGDDRRDMDLISLEQAAERYKGIHRPA